MNAIIVSIMLLNGHVSSIVCQINEKNSERSYTVNEDTISTQYSGTPIFFKDIEPCRKLLTQAKNIWR